MFNLSVYVGKDLTPFTSFMLLLFPTSLALCKEDTSARLTKAETLLY